MHCNRCSNCNPRGSSSRAAAPRVHARVCLVRTPADRNHHLRHCLQAKRCQICLTALGPFVGTAASLGNTCDSYAKVAADFTSCRMSWVTRFDRVAKVYKDGCYGKANSTSVRKLQNPCPNWVRVVCGIPVNGVDYCDPVPGYENPFW